MTANTAPDRKQAMAQRRIALFQTQMQDWYGEETAQDILNFAAHAAFPLTLTTDLSYCLRQHFFPALPWSVAADLLLSGLCEPVGYDLYEMPVAIRQPLLAELVDRLGEARLDELSSFMADYIRHRLEIDSTDRAKQLGDPPHWLALACLKNIDLDQVIRQIRDDLRRLWAEQGEQLDPTDWFRLANLLESQEDLLAQRGFSPVSLADLQSLASEVASGQIVDELDTLRNAMLQAGFPPLQTRTIEYATVTTTAAPAQTTEPLYGFEIETVTVNASGQLNRKQTHIAYAFTERLNDTGAELRMVAIPSGKFLMGWFPDEPRKNSNALPQHEVTVLPFFISQTVITQAQWRAVSELPKILQDLNPDPASFKGADLPVEQVSWNDAVEFCQRLSFYTGRLYRLPTEAEWEYACRAGTTTPFYFGETVTGELANYNSSAIFQNEKRVKWRQKTTPVKSFPPNVFGLYDMHGNVLEWCQDHWHDSYEGAPANGSAWLTDDETSFRVIRGGSWGYIPWDCRSAYRYFNSDERNDFTIGFRIVCSAPSTLLYQN